MSEMGPGLLKRLRARYVVSKKFNSSVALFKLRLAQVSELLQVRSEDDYLNLIKKKTIPGMKFGVDFTKEIGDSIRVLNRDILSRSKNIEILEAKIRHETDMLFEALKSKNKKAVPKLCRRSAYDYLYVMEENKITWETPSSADACYTHWMAAPVEQRRIQRQSVIASHKRDFVWDILQTDISNSVSKKIADRTEEGIKKFLELRTKGVVKTQVKNIPKTMVPART